MPRNQRARSKSPSTRLRERSVDMRNDGKMSCAECRRLRIHCDRGIPCGACVRRECENLCPHGTKTTADGTRYVIAATRELHSTIASLRDRARALETALNDIHLRRTGRTHPLMAMCGDSRDPGGAGEIYDDPVDQLADELHDKATLVRGEDGSQRITSGGFDRSWVTHAIDQVMFAPALPQTSTHAELSRGIRHLPFVPYPPLEVDPVSILRGRLPSDEIRNELLKTFEASVRLMFLPAFTVEYVQEHLIPRALDENGTAALLSLCTLFALLGIGALFAVEGPGEAPEVALYGGSCAEGLASMGVLAAPSLELVEGMYARSMLEFFRQGSYEEPTRCLFAITAHMCYALGLHRDGNSMGLRPEVITRRRLVFWMVFKTDTWESLTLGRPASIAFNHAYVDAQYLGLKSTLDHATPPFLKVMIVMADIAYTNLCLKTPSYSEILRLDEKVRKIGLLKDQESPVLVAPPSLSLIYLHRTFYVRALREGLVDPFQSRYSPSVHAVLRSARETITWSQCVIQQAPAMCARLPAFWNIGLNAAIVYKLLLDHAPSCERASEARAGLELAVDLFSLGTQYGSERAKRALSIMKSRGERLKLSQHTIFDEHPQSDPSDVDDGITSPVSSCHEGSLSALLQSPEAYVSLEFVQAPPLTPSSSFGDTKSVTSQEGMLHLEQSGIEGEPLIPSDPVPPWDGVGWPSMEQGPMHPVVAVPDLPQHSDGEIRPDNLNSEWNLSWM